MDQADLGLERFDAGADYVQELRKLNCQIESAFWAHDKTVQRFVLVLVTPFFDSAGPLAMMRLLFKAYNAAATTDKIDPFIIRLHSPRHRLYRDMLHVQHNERLGGVDLTQEEFNRKVVSGQIKPIVTTEFKSGDLEGFGTWIYVAKMQKKVAPSQVVVLNQWKRFERSIMTMAA